MKTAPAFRATCQGSFEVPSPSYSQTNQSQIHERWDSGHMPVSPQTTSPVSHGYPGFISPLTPTPTIQSPLEVIPHLLSRIGPNTDVRIEDSFNVGDLPPPSVRRKISARSTVPEVDVHLSTSSAGGL
ncbi:unnamed protein product [Cyclocybe aegerita]|uniref:Uncharacterized protein n=1 Tax=Cyclocybe aegerita TaxID=1973307 RepID=A0A8S0XWX2_CYCAE|nr:unnamed protein product [Cyclocybe aegerita]CAA7270601.1 unnamed protein product [Cyclocybe aegerita]